MEYLLFGGLVIFYLVKGYCHEKGYISDECNDAINDIVEDTW